MTEIPESDLTLAATRVQRVLGDLEAITDVYGDERIERCHELMDADILKVVAAVLSGPIPESELAAIIKPLPDSAGWWTNLDTGEQWAIYYQHATPNNLPMFGHRINEQGCCVGGDYVWSDDSDTQIKRGRWVHARADILRLTAAIRANGEQSDFSNTLCNINDTCRIRGFTAGPSGTSTEDRVIAMALDSLRAALQQRVEELQNGHLETLRTRIAAEIEQQAVFAPDKTTDELCDILLTARVGIPTAYDWLMSAIAVRLQSLQQQLAAAEATASTLRSELAYNIKRADVKAALAQIDAQLGEQV